jgi:hypothetical protein
MSSTGCGTKRSKASAMLRAVNQTAVQMMSSSVAAGRAARHRATKSAMNRAV